MKKKLLADAPEQLAGFNLYPNQVTENVTTEFGLENTETFFVQIYNMLGELVSSVNYSSLNTGSNQLIPGTTALTNGFLLYRSNCRRKR